MNSFGRAAWFYCIGGFLLAFYIPQAAGALVYLLATSVLYAMLKLVLFRAGGMQICRLWFGLPGLVLSKGTFFGVPCGYGALPFYPFTEYRVRDARLHSGHRSQAVLFRAAFGAFALNICCLFVFVTFLATLAYWAWRYPNGQTLVEVSTVRQHTGVAGIQLEPHDHIAVAGGVRVSDRSQLISAGKSDDTVIIERAGAFLPPIPHPAFRTAVATGQIELADRPIPSRIRVRDVTPSSPASDLGLRRGDIILTVDGTSVRSINELVTAFGAAPAFPMSLQISRNGAVLQPVNLRGHDVQHNSLGLVVDCLHEIRPRPVRVRDLTTGGPGALSGLARGDLLLHIDSTPLDGLTDFQERTAHIGAPVALTVYRGTATANITVIPRLVEGSPSTVGASVEELPFATVGFKSAIVQGFKFACYAMTVPVQLAAQIVHGVPNPHGIYGIWSSFLSLGVPSIERGEAAAASFGEGVAYSCRMFPAFCLSAAIPFMIMLEYLCACRLLIAGLRGPRIRVVVAFAACLALGVAVFGMGKRQRAMMAFEFPSFDDRILTVRSLWTF